jgi:nitroreductase
VNRKVAAARSKSAVAEEGLGAYESNFTCFQKAPAVLVASFLKASAFHARLFELDEENAHYSGELLSVSMAVMNFLLFAESQGLGTLVMTAPLVAAREIREILDIPARYLVACFICLGYPAEKPTPPERKPLDTVFRVMEAPD